MTQVSLTILHTPDAPARRGFLRQMIEALGGYSEARKKTAQFNVEIAPWDRSQLWASYSRAWVGYGSAATHHVVLSDDMLPVAGFLESLPMLAEARPEHMVGFFAMRAKATDAARARGDWWWTASAALWGGAIMLPVPMIDDLMAWDAREVNPSYLYDDVRMRAYGMKHGLLNWMTTPSLVEHIGAAQSALGHPNRRRVARWLLEGRADDVPWGEIPEKPVHDGSTSSVTPDYGKMFGDRASSRRGRPQSG